MENVIHRLTLDLTRPDTIPRVEVQQDNARSLSISLTQGGRPYWIAEGVTAVFSARKPDGNPLFNGCTIEKNRVVYDFTDQTTNVAGIVECEILLYSGDERILASPRFELAIDELIHRDGDVPESAPEISALTQMVAAGTAMIEDLRVALGDLEGVEEILAQARMEAQRAAEAATAAKTVESRVNSAVQQANKYSYEANLSMEAAGNSAQSAQEAAARAAVCVEDAVVQSETAGTYAKQAKEAAQEAKDAVASGGGIAEESDPTVPKWAKQTQKPSYTAEEVGAEPAGTVESNIQSHNVGRYAHEDIRLELRALSDRINAALNSTDTELDQLSEIVAYIRSNKSLIDAITTSKVSVADIVDNLVTNVPGKPLSAAMGVALASDIDSVRSSLGGYQPKGNYLTSAPVSSVNGKTGAVQLSAADVGAMSESGANGIIVNLLDEAKKSGEFDGEDGRGIKSIARTSGNGAAGTVDTYTITYTDDTTGSYQVRNGADGTNGANGSNGITPTIGANGNWYLGETDTGVKAQGEDGGPGSRGPGILKVTTTPTSYTTSAGGKSPIKRMAISTIMSQAGVDEVLVGDCISHGYYLYHIYYLDDTYAYMDTYQSIRGATGAAGADGEAATFEITGVTALAYGEAPSATEADGSTATARKYIVGIPAGEPGAPGATPVKGVDYWTDTDKAQIVADVIRELGGSPVFGVVGEDGSIVISGLADGSYTVKYEMEDGSTVDIGALVVGAVGPAYTNLAEPRPENTTDYTIWCSDARMGSNGTPAANAGYTCTNFFALGNGDVIRIKGFKIERVGLYSSDKTPLPSGVSGLAALQTNSYIKAGYSQTDEFTTFTANNGNIAYARLSGWVNTTADAVIITKNEEIV